VSDTPAIEDVERLEVLVAKLDVLDHAVKRARARAFWRGVLAGALGTYLGLLLPLHLFS
jgi:hypothetical protein